MFTLEHVTDEHKKLTQILKDDNVTRLVVEHKDRLTRFGFNYIKTLFHGKIVVVNEVNDQEQDLIQDFVSIITSFYPIIYGKRQTQRKT